MNNFCPECGSQRIENSKYCINCGYKFPVDNQDTYNQDVNNNQDANNNQNANNNQTDFEINYNTDNNNYDYNTNNNNSFTSDSNSCPYCNTQMNSFTKSGFLSGGNYQSCPNCGLEFRENGNERILTNANEGTRAKARYLNNSFTLSKWSEIFSNNLSDKELEEISKYIPKGYSNLNCPVCNNTLNIYEKDGFLLDSTIFACDTCKTSFEQVNDSFRFFNTAITDTPLWNYYNDLLTMDEWSRIAKGGKSNNELAQEQQEELARYKNQDLQVFLDSLSTNNPMLPAVNSVGIMLKNNEYPVLELNNITLQEPRAVRVSKGGYGGTSIRIAKGITLHTGGTRGQSESHDEIRNIDVGDLLITNKRVIFLGSNRTTNIDINKIVSIEDYSDGIKIQRSNKQKPEYFIGVNNNALTVNIEGREHNITFNGTMIREVIVGRLN